MIRRVVWTAGCMLVLATSAAGQDGTAFRIGQGDPLSPAANGEPRFREDTGWDKPDFNSEFWGVTYGTELSPDPWTVVFQGDRTNAAFTAAANKLTLDLGGFRYDVKRYVGEINGERAFIGGEFTVFDGTDNGSYLRVTNGTLGGDTNYRGRVTIGSNGHSGQLNVDHATLDARDIYVGGAAGSSGTIILGEEGKIVGSHSVSSIFVGSAADGTITLNGDGSALSSVLMNIGNRANSTSGTVIVNHANALVSVGNMQIANAPPADMHSNYGLRIEAGRVDVQGDLLLSGSSKNSYGAVLINGGTLAVQDLVDFRQPFSSPNATGGKLFLHGGKLIVTDFYKFQPEETDEFYWKSGTVRFTTANLSLNQDQILQLTNQGERSYQQGRRAGAIATGQTLAADGTLTLMHGAELAGGTIQSAGPLIVEGPLSGYGTLDAVVAGTGTLTSTSGGVLEIGALNGTNPLNGDGTFRVGHLNQDATHSGAITGGGQFHKVGTGTQTITGSLSNSGGVDVEEGTLAFEGSGASLETSNVSVATAGRLDLLSGSSGLLDGSLQNAGQVAISSGASLTVDGGLVNEGWLINNGTVTANVTGPGKVSGTGSFSGALELSTGSILAPGNSIGIMDIENMALDGGGLLEFEIAAANGIEGTGWDLVSVSQALSLSASAGDPFTIALISLDPSGQPGLLADFDAGQPYSWRMIVGQIADPSFWSPDRFMVDTTRFANQDALSAGYFSVSSASDGVYLDYNIQSASMPEPSSSVLLLMLLPVAYGWRRRKANPHA